MRSRSRSSERYYRSDKRKNKKKKSSSRRSRSRDRSSKHRSRSPKSYRSHSSSSDQSRSRSRSPKSSRRSRSPKRHSRDRSRSPKKYVRDLSRSPKYSHRDSSGSPTRYSRDSSRSGSKERTSSRHKAIDKRNILTPEEQLKKKVQLALRAAADADSQLKGVSNRDIEIEKQNEISISSQLSRVNAIDEINAAGFQPQTFVSGRSATKQVEEELTVHDSAIFGKSIVSTDIGNKASKILKIDENNLAHEKAGSDMRIAQQYAGKQLLNCFQCINYRLDYISMFEFGCEKRKMDKKADGNENEFIDF